MALLREVQKPRRDFAQLSRLVGLHTLVQRHAEVIAPVNHQKGCGPSVHQITRIEIRVGLGLRLGPVGSAQVVVGKEELLGRAVPALHVKKSAMRNQCLEPALVNARELEHAVAAVAGAHCPKAFAVDVRLCGHRINGREVVLHSLTTPIA